jgi:hypothetical protein
MSWNDPEDPAFLFFNPHFSAAITESGYNSNFPSDFPIVRPDPSDIAGTLYAADGGSGVKPLWRRNRRWTRRVRAVSRREHLAPM